MSDLALFAETTYRNQHRRFGIKTDDRRRHMYLIGKTGMGKSTILENMIIDDIRAGRGVAVVDPHGDLAEKVIQYIPANRVNDVIYFNPADVNFPIAFNVVEQVAPHLRHLVASGLIGVFQKLWADSWGPRLEYILRNSILAILDYPNSTLLAVTRMLSDKSFRKKVIENIQDPVVKSFWTKEFAGYADKFAAEAVSPIQNKVGQFLSSSLIRNIVGQTNSSIDLREVMDEGKILIMNLSKGRIGEDNSELLGSMVITKIQLAAMSRVNVTEGERRDFYLYVDEFQNFATDSFANILSEARKYRLNLIMGHQYIEQLNDKVKAAVFGNVGTLVVFRVGATDAEELVKEFTPVFTEEDLVNLPKYNVCLKLMIDGVASDPFSARGLAPLKETERTQNEEKVIRSTRERYSAPREEVEDKIMRWHAEEETPRITVTRPPQTQATPVAHQPVQATRPVAPTMPTYAPQASRQPEPTQTQAPQAPAAPMLDPSVYKYEATCSRCQKVTRVPFKPDGVRPVFCKECLTILRQENEQSTNQRKAIKQKELEQLSARPSYSASFSKPSVKPIEPRKPLFEPVAPVAEQSPRPLSLRELSAEVPNDFHGHKIKKTIEPPRDQNIIQPIVSDDTKDISEDYQESHGPLQPGQPVRFN